MEEVAARPVRIMAVIDDDDLRAAVRAQLERCGHEVVLASDGRVALALAPLAPPEVVLLDLSLRDMDGLEVLRRIQAKPALAGVPVLVLSDDDDADTIAAALGAGAQDHVGNPPAWAVLEARVAGAAAIKRLRDELAEARRQLTEQVGTDQLTGVASRRAGISLLEAAVDAGHAGRRPVVFKIDVDRFKLVNDVYGHAIGDEVLRRVATTLQVELRRGDRLVRWGGDEFVAVLHDADELDAVAVAERLRRAVAGDATLQELGGLSISIGWAGWRGHDPDDLLRAADDAMYAAKRAGRDAVRGAA